MYPGRNLMRKSFCLIVLGLIGYLPGVCAQGKSSIVDKTVVSWNETTTLHFLLDSTLYTEGWDTLAQSRFWQEVISLPGDTCIINIASCRKPVDKIHREVWMNQTEPEKICFKDSVCLAHSLDQSTSLYVTAGKSEFYEVKKILPDISKAITVFRDNHCDPWYAQTILLIESPGRNKAKSSVGANGPFQLMKSVARKNGLQVTKYRDDRTDLQKAAKGAARLLNTACIPYIKKYLDERGINYHETDLWFRLLVLHAYHAGAGNVRCIINTLNPARGGVDLFLQIWQTTCGSFKNESQNYSQIALASLLKFNALIQQDQDTVFLVQGDKLLRAYPHKSRKTVDAYAYLQQTLAAYERDLVDGTVPFDYFMKRVGMIRKQFQKIAGELKLGGDDFVLKTYPSSEEHITNLAFRLSKRQRYDDAIRLLKVNLDMHPNSTAVFDSLSKTYLLSGDRKSAERYSSRSEAVMPASTGRNVD